METRLKNTVRARVEPGSAALLISYRLIRLEWRSIPDLLWSVTTTGDGLTAQIDNGSLGEVPT
jgi:hypothetical protein